MSTFDLVEREIVAEIDGLKGPEASKALAAIAAEARDEVIAADHPSSTATYVDGREGAALDSVRPDGVIRFEFGYLDEVVRQILQMLIDASPVGVKRANADPPTHYKDEHQLFVDGAEVTDLPEKIPATASVVITNLQPYARKVEKGFGPQLLSAHGVYQAVARLSKSRFGNQVRIEYDWRQFPGSGPGGPKTRHGGTATHQQDDNFPVITVSAL